MYVKSRVCSPSPKIVGVRPAARASLNAAILSDLSHPASYLFSDLDPEGLLADARRLLGLFTRWDDDFYERDVYLPSSEGTTIAGHEFPEDLAAYKMVIHCGACMWNRRQVLSRMLHCRKAGVPICNYGMTIAFTLGIFERALAPFPDALEVYREARNS